MSIYRLKVMCKNAQVEVVAKNGVILARELDKYLESFLGRTLSTQYSHETKNEHTVEFIPHNEPLQNIEYAAPKADISQTEGALNESLSLSEFIAVNKGLDIFSEFIISAYYIKKILHESSFTVKFLNSKFYPATGTLVDLSIIEDAKNQGFIHALEEDGVTKYTLSDTGEEFFVNQLRG